MPHRYILKGSRRWGTGTSVSSEKMVSTAVLDVLSNLKLAVAQIRLHPKGSPEVSKASADTHQSLKAFLEKNQQLVLATAHSGLTVNGQPLGPKDFATDTLESALIPVFLESGVRSIVFRKGAGPEEVLTFIDTFVRLKSGREINQRLLAERVTSISVDETEDGDAAPRPEKPDKASGLLPLEKARDAVVELARLRSSAPEELRPGLRKVAHVLMEAFRHDPRQAALLRQSLPAEAADLVPAWMSEDSRNAGQESGPSAQAKALLALPPDEQADLLVREASSLVRDLLAESRSDLAAKVLARLTSVLMDRAPERRAAAADALRTLQPAWESEPLSAARDGFETLLRAALDSEKDPAAYGKLAELAAMLAEARLRQDEPALALETFSLFRRHQTPKEALLAFRTPTATAMLEKIIRSEGFSGVLNRLRTGDPVALRVAEALGDAVAPCLVEEMKKIESNSQRMPFADALSRIGAGGAARLSEELQKSTHPPELLRLLESLPHAAPENIATDALSSTLHHAVSAVRRRSADILTERAYPRSGDLLLLALKEEKEPTNRAAIVDGLGKLRVSAAFEVLATFADDRSEAEELRASACMALARLGHAEAIPILASVATKASRGLGLLKSASPALRITAIRALGQFPTQPAAREALKKITEDSDAAVQAAAKEAYYRPGTKTPSPFSREALQAAAVQEVKASTVKLAGSLQEVAFDQICQLVGTSEKTGLLTLNLDGKVASIWFEQGQVVAAEFDRMQDQTAFNAIARQKKGDFVFQPSERPPERRIQSPVHVMLLEAFRVADEGKK
jgi:hypothetical protein